MSENKENTPKIIRDRLEEFSKPNFQSLENQLSCGKLDLLMSKIDNLSDIIHTMDARLKVVENKCKQFSDCLSKIEC